MRVLVIGSTGYIGSRVIPQLLSKRHHVIAGARNVDDLTRFEWADKVQKIELDVLSGSSLESALLSETVDSIVYLVHSMGGSDFRENDLHGAKTLRDLIDRYRVPNLVFVSGLIPPTGEERLSEHLASRLEVERTLSASSADVVTIRAAMIIGAGSTSFELMAQLAERLPISVIPEWMETNVEPIAVVDLVQAVCGAVESQLPTRHFDVGGGEVLSYSELIQRFKTAKKIERLQFTVPFLPEMLVSAVASWITDVPGTTVTALIESLKEDMVAADDHWIGSLVPKSYRPISIDKSIYRALRSDYSDPMSVQPGDPKWSTGADEQQQSSSGPQIE